MTINPKEMTDIKKLNQLIVNAERQARPDIVLACKERLFELSGAEIADPLERRLEQAVSAYEQTLFEKHGRRQKASYTRRKMKKKSAIEVLEDWANDAKETPGFNALVDNGLAQFTAEYIVVEYPDRFDPDTVASAKIKLEKKGVKFP